MRIAKRDVASNAAAAVVQRLVERDELPAPLTAAQKAQRRAFIAEQRAKWAVMFATKAEVETPLADLDARACKGEHREMVAKAIETRVERLAEEFRRDKPTLSERALRAIGVRVEAAE